MRHALADLEKGGGGGTGVANPLQMQRLKKVIKQNTKKTQKKWKGKRKNRESFSLICMCAHFYNVCSIMSK